jgi:hypothetical protein
MFKIVTYFQPRMSKLFYKLPSKFTYLMGEHFLYSSILLYRVSIQGVYIHLHIISDFLGGFMTMFILLVGEGTIPTFFVLLPLGTSFMRRSATLSCYPYILKNIYIVFEIDTRRLCKVSRMPPTVLLLLLTTGST